MKLILSFALAVAAFAAPVRAGNGPPVASFTMSTNLGVAPFTVAFKDTSTGAPATWFWSFGDGGTSTRQNPSHTFTNIWRQTVVLTVSNAFGSGSSSQPVFQCFPCDALYDWAAGIEGRPATVATLSNSLVPGGNTLGRFTITNRDLRSPDLQGLIFTNLPGMTNGCPVVFSNGVVDANFQATHALAYSYTNNHEQFDFRFFRNCNVTNLVFLFYDSMPLVSNRWAACIDEVNIATTKDSPDLGGYCLNRWLGERGPLLPGSQNNFHTSETLQPTTYGRFMGGRKEIYELPNKLYRILLEENTNGDCVLAIGDPVTSALVGFVTNWNAYENGRVFTAIADGHTSWEKFTANTTSILACHDIISINRPLNWYHVSNVVMYGP
jgi:hypothetical protein